MMFKVQIYCIALLMLAVGNLLADVFSFDQSIDGVSPSSGSPWATVSIYSVDSNTLNIELNPFNLDSDSYVRYWYLNFDYNLNVNQLKFKTVGGDSNTEPSVSTGYNSFYVSNGGLYDIRVHFPEAKQQRFYGGDSVVLEVTAANPIDASMFNFTSYSWDPDDRYYSALEASGLGDKGNKKGTIASNTTAAIPEPSTYLILGFFLAFAGLAGYRKRRAEAQ